MGTATLSPISHTIGRMGGLPTVTRGWARCGVGVTVAPAAVAVSPTVSWLITGNLHGTCCRGYPKGRRASSYGRKDLQMTIVTSQAVAGRMRVLRPKDRR